MFARGSVASAVLSGNEITGSGRTGLEVLTGGQIVSFSDNRIVGNKVDGDPTSTAGKR